MNKYTVPDAILSDRDKFLRAIANELAEQNQHIKYQNWLLYNLHVDKLGRLPNTSLTEDVMTYLKGFGGEKKK